MFAIFDFDLKGPFSNLKAQLFLRIELNCWIRSKNKQHVDLLIE